MVDETLSPSENSELPPEALAADITAQEWRDYLAAIEAPYADQVPRSTIAHNVLKDKANAYLRASASRAPADSTDAPADSASDGVEERVITPEDREAAMAQLAFTNKVLAETGSRFKIDEYIKDDPERADEARRLGLID